jgi:hypothetical protein
MNDIELRHRDIEEFAHSEHMTLAQLKHGSKKYIISQKPNSHFYQLVPAINLSD